MSNRTQVQGQDDGSSQEFPVEKIVNYDPGTDAFTVRWTGYGPDDDTEQSCEDLPYNMVARYFRQHGLTVPPHLKKFLDYEIK